MKAWVEKITKFFIQRIKNFLWEILKVSPLLVILLAAWIIFGKSPQLYSALMSLSMLAIILLAINIFRQFMFPHIKMGQLVKIASKNPIGAAIVFFATMLFIMMVVMITMASASDEVMLSRAKPWIPTLQKNFKIYWPDAPLKHYQPSQIEQESLWKQFAELKTSREHGRCFSQMTIAYNKDGTVRFNKFIEARQRYKELRGWDWQNDPFNAQYHLLFVTLEDHRNFLAFNDTFSTDMDRWAATLVCYNAGCTTVRSRWSVCEKTPGCDSSRWFGGLDSVASVSEAKALLYGRPLAAERNKYPRLIIFTRSLKYKQFFDVSEMNNIRISQDAWRFW